MGVPRGVVLGVIAAQFCVPLIALVASEPPTRLGFQMYSGLGSLDVTVEDEHGQDVEYDPAEVFAVSPRVEIDWTRRLPERLCAIPGAAQVTVERPDGLRTVRC
ncbi:hypothetical protein ASG73_12200 [Janibacter sp. Soil728]|uniref:hypothetical protein n=1 Tax=Janibacter sp. Soil728 TaxID=1736393 RepID=UPI0006F49A89|nr:hypothetical protein [Janibacter sp. Soil728]KRE37059.1 hypothetical protein ASG73_12200 [Janibacter sp. Soil728]